MLPLLLSEILMVDKNTNPSFSLLQRSYRRESKVESRDVGESRGDKTPFVPPGGTPPSSAVWEQPWRSTASFAWFRPNGMILCGGLSRFGHAQAAVFTPYSPTGEAADCEIVLQYL